MPRIVGQIRARWPRVKILLRADSGFARDALMAWCETGAGRRRLRARPHNERLVGALAASDHAKRLGERIGHDVDRLEPTRAPFEAGWRTGSTTGFIRRDGVHRPLASRCRCRHA